MRKYYLALSLSVFISPLLRAQTNSAAPYCNPVFDLLSPAPANGISEVAYGTTVNATTPADGIYTFYNNLPAITATPAAPYSIRVKASGTAARKLVTLHVDWNQDGIFDQTMNTPAAELQGMVQAGTGGQFTISGTAYDTAREGTTRVRIMYTDFWNPCLGLPTIGGGVDGEVEDYTMTVSGTKAIPRVLDPINITPTSAMMRGTVHANGPGTATVILLYGKGLASMDSVSLGTVNANAHTLVAATVPDLEPATTYVYRIKATNAYGTSYSRATTFGTQRNTQTAIGQLPAEVCKIIPNPGRGIFKLSGLTAGRSYTAAVYDVTGRKVHMTALASDQSLDLTPLSAGTYFLRLFDRRAAGPGLATIRVVIE